MTTFGEVSRPGFARIPRSALEQSVVVPAWLDNECTFCPEDDLNKTFPCFPPCLPFKLSLFTKVTCRDAACDLSIRELESDDFCADFSPLSYCGCAPPPNVCKICSNEQCLPTLERALMFMMSLVKGLMRLLRFACLATGLVSDPCECVDPSSNEPQQTLTPSTEAPHTFLRTAEPPKTFLSSTEPLQTLPLSTESSPPETTSGQDGVETLTEPNPQTSHPSMEPLQTLPSSTESSTP
eukprot:CAMPEP_0202502382 /NCGR_PEP_ID=MMETSP1361-20130828/38803_1 /ASSEMBLY_ACC=CAM_ASM_000849 /TAXON_ID=210615 /ORGANISM="Staurosira complex sp., Strain CCMP2646" /LENGTH=237 /DNA_ID=CAMNT_0049135385 /DNA_START=27 /DNA_END=741 /DNA_ORIENTATION=+